MPEYGKLYEIYIRAYRSTWMERGPGRGMGRELLVGGGWRYCRVSAAEPIKTSTAHYFACFSFDNNAGSDPNRIKKRKKKTGSRLQSQFRVGVELGFLSRGGGATIYVRC